MWVSQIVISTKPLTMVLDLSSKTSSAGFMSRVCIYHALRVCQIVGFTSWAGVGCGAQSSGLRQGIGILNPKPLSPKP